MGCTSVHPTVGTRRGDIPSGSVIPLARKSLFLTRKSKMLARESLLLTRKSEMLARKSLLLTRKSKMLARKSLLLTRKSEMLARKSLFLTSKSEMLTRKSLFLTRQTRLTPSWRDGLARHDATCAADELSIGTRSFSYWARFGVGDVTEQKHSMHTRGLAAD